MGELERGITLKGILEEVVATKNPDIVFLRIGDGYRYHRVTANVEKLGNEKVGEMIVCMIHVSAGIYKKDESNPDSWRPNLNLSLLKVI